MCDTIHKDGRDQNPFADHGLEFVVAMFAVHVLPRPAKAMSGPELVTKPSGTISIFNGFSERKGFVAS
jgi:hypothetical protein